MTKRRIVKTSPRSSGRSRTPTRCSVFYRPLMNRPPCTAAAFPGVTAPGAAEAADGPAVVESDFPEEAALDSPAAAAAWAIPAEVIALTPPEPLTSPRIQAATR